jgi:hypothetical protein
MAKYVYVVVVGTLNQKILRISCLNQDGGQIRYCIPDCTLTRGLFVRQIIMTNDARRRRQNSE